MDMDNKQLKPDFSFFFLAEENHGFGTFRNKCAIDRERKKIKLSLYYPSIILVLAE